MVNKKGYIKTLEAVIAIVIILIFTFAVTPKPEPSYQLPSSVENAQNYILKEIAGNAVARQKVMDSDPDVSGSIEEAKVVLDDIVTTNLPSGYEYALGLCKESACASNLTPIAEGRSVYTAEAMIGSGGTTADTPMIVRIWMWRKQQTA
ncbi:MAG: hypothetical protein AABX27_03545 [Nanoarchaeota archaeon]